MADRVKLDFYALGKTDKNPDINFFSTNKGMRDKSSNILERNALSLNSSNLEKIRNNYRSLHTLNEANSGNNNYLQPIPTYNKRERYGVEDQMTNTKTYLNTRNKYFASDFEKPFNTGSHVARAEFANRKSLDNRSPPSTSLNKELKDNSLFFDMNNKLVLRYPKGYWAVSESKMDRTQLSKQAPDWFHIVTEKKSKAWNDAFVKNGDTLSVFSRYQKWITVTPKNKDRRKPLEKVKITNMEETSKIMPNWMQIKIDKEKIKEDPMKSIEYKPLREDKKLVVLVDKISNNRNAKTKSDRSVFSYMDFRHNLAEKSDADFHMSKVSQMPKEFFKWNDDRVFNPKFKRDVPSHSLEKNKASIKD